MAPNTETTILWKEFTCSQDQIYLSDIQGGRSPLHNLTFAYRLDTLTDLHLYRQAFQILVQEADCLRLRIFEADGRARQAILTRSELSLQVVDFSGEANPQAAYRQWAETVAGQPVDITEPLVGFWLALVDDRHAYWVACVHHIIADSWGLFLLFERLKAIYAALRAGEDPGPNPLPPMSLLLESDQNYRISDKFHDDQAYWRDYLKDAPGRVNIYGYTGMARVIPVYRKHTSLSSSLVEQICQRLAEPHFAGHTANVALFNLLLTAFTAFLYRISGQDDFMVAMPYLNRPGIARQVPGLTVQAAPLRVQIHPNETFRALYDRVREESRRNAAHSRYPVTNPDNTYYNVIFNFHNRPYPGHAEAVEAWWFNNTEALDLCLNVLNPDLDQGRVELGFDIPGPVLDLVAPETIFQHFTNLLQALLDNPDCALDQAPMLSAEERRGLLGGVDAVSIPDIGRPFTQAFADQVARAPDAVAVRRGERSFTYRELDQRTDSLAAALRARGVRPGTPVGMLLEDRMDMIFGLVGIKKSGGLYVPLDPTYPDDRLAYMIRDAGIDIIVTEPAMDARTAQYTGQRVNIHDLQPAPPDFTTHIPAWDEPGYITYTSGSTGRPKGVVTSHGALADDTAAMRDYLELTPQDNFLFFAAIGFDAAFEEILPCLISGGTVIPRPGGLLSVDEFNRVLRDEHVTAMSIPASFWSEWTRGLALTGQPVPDKLVKMMVYAEEPNIQDYITWSKIPGAQHVRWINTYGPTEAAITTTMFVPSPKDGDPAGWSRFPIGLPLPNHSVYVLDRSRNLAPRGTPGELYIGGDTALRYQNMPEESAAVFLPDPFRAEPGKTMYKTGDRVRWLPTGELEFLGRFDNQVKLHGFRIELGEIETRLSAHPQIKQAVVLVKGKPGASQRLVAYVVPNNGRVDADSVRDFLHETLPAYMLPTDFISLPEFPITPHGKIDKRALPEPQATLASTHDHLLPETNLEVELIVIWEDVLGVKPIYVDQNYFDLGGNSLLGVRIFSQLESKLGLRLPVSELFRSPTIRQLARFMEANRVSYRPSTVIPLRPGGDRLPLFLIHGWGGGVVGYAHLIQKIDPHYPIYGVQAAGLSRGEAPDTTIEAMVDRYILAIKQVQPTGPYRLGGYCTGGIIAYAVACELVARGDAVDLVANIEGEPPNTPRDNVAFLSPRRMATFFRSIPYWIRDYRELGQTGIRQRLLNLFRSIYRRMQYRHVPVKYEMEDIILDDTTPLPDYQKDLLLKQVLMMEAYHPKPYPHHMALYLARYPTISGALFGPLDPTLGWDRLVQGGLTTSWIKSGHRNIHIPPHCAELADAISSDLRKADAALNDGVPAPATEAALPPVQVGCSTC